MYEIHFKEIAYKLKCVKADFSYDKILIDVRI